MLTHLSLFTGIGGIDLAAEWAGFKTVGQCEKAEYPYRILCKHWPDVPKWRDVRDVRIKDQVTLLSGGFPCQPFSNAGKRRGSCDDRFLWPEMFRVIREARPSWIVAENVVGFISLALDTAIADLESEGYSCTTFNIPACGVQAWHERQRIFVVAYSNHTGDRTSQYNTNGDREETIKRWLRFTFPESSRLGSILFDTDSNGLNGLQDTESIRPRIYRDKTGTEGSGQSSGSDSSERGNTRVVSNPDIERSQGYGQLCEGRKRTHKWHTWTGSKTLEGIWEFEPDVGRVAHGISDRVDRLICLGNAVVPQQVYPIVKAIAEIENEKL